MTNHIENRAVVEITGSERLTFLQGLVTNDVFKATEDQPIYTAMLTPKGRVNHDFFVFVDGESVFITPEKHRVDDLLKLLKRYKLRADVQLFIRENLFLVAGEGAPDPRHPDMPPIALSTTYGAIDPNYENQRLLLCIPDGSRDMIPEKSLPLESRLEELNAIDYKKGCYMGQELTARTHYTGQVRKSLMVVQTDGKTPAFDEPLLNEDAKEVGKMRSTNGKMGIALVRIEEVEVGDILSGVTLL